MQVEAIYDHGRLHFKEKIDFTHARFHVLVSIPDGEVIRQSPCPEYPPSEQASSKNPPESNLIKEIRRILGSYYRQRPEASAEEDRAARIDALEEKYS
uniref:Uncharacterized protein n=1 Tax=Candidatus Kentrum sp. SD TaxID=2126332 RepID=A0A450YDD0_9GAMM|nr:MAG: hypothetical protein BECKSD772F_GA0070984_10411 [Candidatus Kentron sp. SD]VFK44519.1 MAG: hypothetical protein BECKSD772E_GA0070983_10391 [Candidatus Kentron sp. SD]